MTASACAVGGRGNSASTPCTTLGWRSSGLTGFPLCVLSGSCFYSLHKLQTLIYLVNTFLPRLNLYWAPAPPSGWSGMGRTLALQPLTRSENPEAPSWPRPAAPCVVASGPEGWPCTGQQPAMHTTLQECSTEAGRQMERQVTLP